MMHRPTLEQDALGIAAAAVTFNVVASLSQTIQCGLKISTGRPVMAAAASFVTVIGGALASWESAELLCDLSSRCRRASTVLSNAAAHHGLVWPPALSAQSHTTRHLRAAGDALEDFLPAEGVGVARRAWAWAKEEEKRHSGRATAAVLGVALFAALGGQRLSFSPSSVRHLGAFARKGASLPATLAYATDMERRTLAKLGRTFGCHTCGAKRVELTRASAAAKSGLLRGTVHSWIADHMPPVKYVNLQNKHLWRRLTGRTVTQRFFPQCSACSTVQSLAVRSSAANSLVSHHMLGFYNVRGPLGSWRPYHFTGGVLVASAVTLDRAAEPVTKAVRSLVNS